MELGGEAPSVMVRKIQRVDSNEECGCTVRFADPNRSASAVRPSVALAAAAPAMLAPPSSRRARLWELSEALHCSIVGTCFATHELRRLLRKLVRCAADATDHELHSMAVGFCAKQGIAAKLLDKALDERHRTAVRRFGEAKGAAAVLASWRTSVEAGEIPGAYWAALTHPATDRDVIRVVFGEVHMLSHLVGAANRADIRRLAAQDREIAALRAEMERRRERSRADLAERDGRIRELLAAAAARSFVPAASMADRGPANGCPESRSADLQDRLVAAEARIATLEARSAAAETAAEAALASGAEARREAEALVREATAVEAVLAFSTVAGPPVGAPPTPTPHKVLYVGGRQHQVPALRAGATRMGTELLHHEGGADGAGTASLAALVARVDLVVFPVDCVSHDAALAVKRHCGRLGRPFLPLRSSGVSSFIAALAGSVQAGIGRSLRQDRGGS